MKWAFKGIICIVLVGVIMTLIGTVSILSGWYGLKPKKADCIIILGCKVNGSEPSPFLISRMDEAIRLYKAGYGKYIIASGGQGSNENLSEAEAMKDYLVSRGIEASKILIENKSTSTMTNLENSKVIMEQNMLSSAVIVSNKYHLKRASLMAKKIGITASYSGVYNTKHKLDEFSGFLREILAIMKFYVLG